MTTAITNAALTSPIGVVAGSGIFPLEVIKAALKQNLQVVAVAHRNETAKEIEALARTTWIKVGELNKIIRTFKAAGVKQVAFAGGISRIRLFHDVKLDWRALALIARIRSVQDDVILRGIAGELEREGITVFPPHQLLAESVVPAGLLTKRSFSEEHLADAALGWRCAAQMGALDVGQTVVVRKGLVVAVEAVEGTDQAIARGGALAGPGCVVVKICKPQQDERLDLPTIGPATIESLRSAKAAGILLQAGKCLMLSPVETVRIADQAGIVIDSRVSVG